MNEERFEKFTVELLQLLEKHQVALVVTGYEGIDVFDGVGCPSPIYANGFNNCIVGEKK